jgi:hypothetical protein
MAGTDSRPQFQVDVTVPGEARFVPTVRDLAIQAARFAGCSPPDADAFGHSVQQVFEQYLRNRNSDAPIAIVLRRDHGQLEVLVDERTISLDV